MFTTTHRVRPQRCRSGVAGRLRPSYARMLAARFSNAGAGCIQGSEPLRVPAPRGEPEHECDAPCNVVDDLAAALQWDVTDASGKEALEKIYRVAREKVGTGRIQKLVRAAASAPLSAQCYIRPRSYGWSSSESGSSREAAAEDSIGTERIAALVCRRIIHHDSIAEAMLWPYHACLPSHECDSPSFVVLVHRRIIPTTVTFVDCKNR
jgi:hypothetical protein